MAKTPKEAAIAVEDLLKAEGYVLGELSFWELIGSRVGRYDFGEGVCVVTCDLEGSVEAWNAEPMGGDE